MNDQISDSLKKGECTLSPVCIHYIALLNFFGFSLFTHSLNVCNVTMRYLLHVR